MKTPLFNNPNNAYLFNPGYMRINPSIQYINNYEKPFYIINQTSSPQKVTMQNNNININNINNNMKGNFTNNIYSYNNSKFNNCQNNLNLIDNNNIKDLCKDRSGLNNDKKEDNKNSPNLDEEKEITIYFNFLDDSNEEVKAKYKEKLCDLFKKINKYSSHYQAAIHNFEVIDINKTIAENHIKNGDKIFFIQLSKEKGENKNISFERDEIEQLQKWLQEYKDTKLSNYNSVMNTIVDKTNIPPFNLKINKEDLINFIISKGKEVGIKVKEHPHILVYCLTQFNWFCKKCNKIYSKYKGTYFCSFCDFNLCDSCRAEGNYSKKKEFPENIQDSEIKLNYKFLPPKNHEHRLVYCRTSRKLFESNRWFCNNCQKEFNNDIWSFYCTLCDYDLCIDCAGIH